MQDARFDPILLSRIEDAGINASAPREQRWLDGWLVRSSPSKAKRARCVQAVAEGRMAVPARVAACQEIYDQAGLQMFVRITPFSLPAGLDEALGKLGMSRVDDTRVMVKADLADPIGSGAADPSSSIVATGAGSDGNPTALRFQIAEVDTFADWVGAARGSPAAERRAHADRLRNAPVPLHPIFAIAAGGEVVAAGHLALEAEIVGLYDVVTAEAHRGVGIGAHLCSHLLERARTLGARTAYLQVDAANDTARRLYRRLGFSDAYGYHYRAMPLITAA